MYPRRPGARPARAVLRLRNDVSQTKREAFFIGWNYWTSAAGHAIPAASLHHTTRFALIDAVVVASHTLVDETGVRLSVTRVACTTWVFLLTAPASLTRLPLLRRPDCIRHLYSRWYFGLIGGECTLVAYILVLWAMMKTPLPWSQHCVEPPPSSTACAAKCAGARPGHVTLSDAVIRGKLRPLRCPRIADDEG